MPGEFAGVPDNLIHLFCHFESQIGAGKLPVVFPYDRTECDAIRPSPPIKNKATYPKK